MDLSLIDQAVTSAQLSAVGRDIYERGDLIHVTHGSKPMCRIDSPRVAEALTALGQKHAWREPFVYLDYGPADRYLFDDNKIVETVTQHQETLQDVLLKCLEEETQGVNTFIAARAARCKTALAAAQTPRELADVLFAAAKDVYLPSAVEGILLGYGKENSLKFALDAWRWPWQMLTPAMPEPGNPAVPTFVAWNNPESVALLDRYEGDARRIGDTVLQKAVVNGRRSDMQAARVVLASLFTEKPQS